MAKVVCDDVSVTRIKLEREQRDKGSMLRFKVRTYTRTAEDRQAIVIVGMRNDTAQLEIGNCYDLNQNAGEPDEMHVDPSIATRFGRKVEELLSETTKKDRRRVVVPIDADGMKAGFGDLKCRVDGAELMDLLKGKKPRLEATLLVLEKEPTPTSSPAPTTP